MATEKRILNPDGLPRLTIEVDGGYEDGGYTIKDERTPADMNATIGFIVATDSFMSDEAGVKRSIVACPVRNREDREKVMNRFRLRSEFKRVRDVLGKVTDEGRIFRPKMVSGDVLHIYDLRKSFRYPL